MTYEMLQNAHALLKNSADIVVGFVETHGRAETEVMLRGLEVVPRKRIEYRDQTLEEMNLDAVIARGDSFPTRVPREPGLVGVRRHGTLLCVSHFSSSKKHAGKRPTAPRCRLAGDAPGPSENSELAVRPLASVGRRCAAMSTSAWQALCVR